MTKKSRTRDETEDGAPSSSSASAKADEKKPTKMDPAERVRQATAKMTAFEKYFLTSSRPLNL